MILSVFTLFVILSLGRAQIQVSAEKNFPDENLQQEVFFSINRVSPPSFDIQQLKNTLQELRGYMMWYEH